MDHENFDAVVARTADGYETRVVASPAGKATTAFALPFRPSALEELIVLVGQPRTRARRSLPVPAIDLPLKDLGGRLFDAAFGGQVGDVLGRSELLTRERRQGLRIRLRLQDAPDLADVPWECLYDRTSDSFLALSTRTPVIRYPELPLPPWPLTVSGPLQVLVVISDPVISDLYPLDVEREWSQVQDAVASLSAAGRVVLHRLDRPTFGRLQAWLRRHEAHVLHFIGHGGFHAPTSSGFLLLEDERRVADPVSGDDLGNLVRDHPSLRLAVLNSCEGARTDLTDPFAGTAQTLVRKGVPAVIAMQFEITDKAAVAFATELYKALADGAPVDGAVASARQAIRHAGCRTEWATPVLYLRASSGHIFDIEQSLPAPEDREPVGRDEEIVSPPPPDPPPFTSPEVKVNPVIPILGSPLGAVVAGVVCIVVVYLLARAFA